MKKRTLVIGLGTAGAALTGMALAAAGVRVEDGLGSLILVGGLSAASFFLVCLSAVATGWLSADELVGLPPET